MRVFLLIVAVIASAALILGQVNNLARSFTGSRLLHNGYGDMIASLNQQFRRALSNGTLESSKKNLDRAVEQTVEYMLFVDEAPLRDPIKGDSTFTTTFPQRGPRDKQGRSLRDFDLNKRLFRYPLSYMIYTHMFDAMPTVARDRVYQRLLEVLSGRDTNPKFAHLSATDGQAILEILHETKPGLR
jgi:hypothetical protein